MGSVPDPDGRQVPPNAQALRRRARKLRIQGADEQAEQLELAARELTGGGRLRRAWLAHDLFPSDGHPFIGPIHGHWS